MEKALNFILSRAYFKMSFIRIEKLHIFAIKPRFPGAIGVSSKEHGLFMLQPDWSAIQKLESENRIRGKQERFRKILQAPEGATCRPVETRECKPKAC